MRRMSAKRAAREAEAAPFRKALLRRVGHCEICWPRRRTAKGDLEVHEIARGRNRQKALDQPYAVLVVCRWCHEALESRAAWPEARQLAMLRRSRPEDMDLAAYNALVGLGPDRITEEEVESHERN